MKILYGFPAMERWRKLEIGLFAVLALLAFAPAGASAATTITVNDSSSDAPLSGGGPSCTSTDASKGCTLRAAVQLANLDGGEVTIDVPAGTFTNTIANGGTLVVEEGVSVVIVGAGEGSTIIDGGEAGSVLEVEEEASLTVDGATVRNGDEEYGGGIYVYIYGSLTLEHSTVTENHASYEGGGIYGEPSATITITQSRIVDNTAGHYGGGILAGLSGPYLCDLARRASKASAGAAGATIAAGAQSPLTITQSTIDGNTVEAGAGGGIFAWQAYECQQQTTIRNAPAHFSAKDAHPQLANLEGPLMTIEQSTISRNKAEGEIEGEYIYEGIGGGIFEVGMFSDPIVNSTIAQNFATFVAGGLAVAGGGTEDLVSDTVFNNTVEAQSIEFAARGFHHGAARPNVTVDPERVQPGSNLATETIAEENEYERSSSIALRNTIVAEPEGSEAENCEGEIESLVPGSGYNLDFPSSSLSESSTDTCGLSEGDHDLLGVAPGLDPKGLQDNGGPTQTIALLSTSPAIGVVPLAEDCEGSVFGPSLVDQRGEKRPGIPGRECDIGAYEYQQPPAKEEPKQEPTPTPTSTPAQAVLPFKVVTPNKKKRCLSRRYITIHIQHVKRLHIVSAVVSIDGHHRRTLKGKHLRTPINLRGLPKGTFTVKIVARQRNGHKLHGKRVYHTCHTKLPGRAYLPL